MVPAALSRMWGRTTFMEPVFIPTNLLEIRLRYPISHG